MSDEQNMQVGKVESTVRQGVPEVGGHWPPKPPKRVAVRSAVCCTTSGDIIRDVIANDGTMWNQYNQGWTRLPDLPQD